MERLNKYLAHAGTGSRRHCDDLIFRGRVKIDGQVVREPGARVDPQTQEIAVDDQPIHAEQLVYWLVNKPRGYLCTNHDPEGRSRVIDLIPHVPQRVYTVGRLDEDSEGLLLMTNDGDLAFKLTHPRFGIAKTYLVQVAGKPGKQDVEQLLEGIWLSDGKVRAKRIRRLKSQGDSTWMEVVLCEGKNREIRRMLAKQEHKVMRLKRTAIGPIRLDRLGKGKSRRLLPDEVATLRAAVERRPREKVPHEKAPHEKVAHAKAPQAKAPHNKGDARPAAAVHRDRPVKPEKPFRKDRNGRAGQAAEPAFATPRRGGGRPVKPFKPGAPRRGNRRP